MTDREGTRSSVAALLGALTGSLALLTAAFLLAPMFIVILPMVSVPILWLSYRRGPMLGAVAAIGASGVTLALGGPSGLPLIPLFLAGVVQAAMLRAEQPAARVLVVSTAFMFLTLGGTFGLTYLLEGPQLAVIQREVLKQLLEARTVLGGQGMSKAEAAKIIALAVKSVPYVLPALTTLMAVAMGVLSYSAGKLSLGSRALQLPRLSPFVHWQLPWYFAWGYVLGLGGVLFAEYADPWRFAVGVVGSNLLILFATLFLVQGLSIVIFLLNKYHVRPLWRGFLLAAVMVFPLLLQAASWLGLLDTWFNYRKQDRAA